MERRRSTAVAVMLGALALVADARAAVVVDGSVWFRPEGVEFSAVLESPGGRRPFTVTYFRSEARAARRMRELGGSPEAASAPFDEACSVVEPDVAAMVQQRAFPAGERFERTMVYLRARAAVVAVATSSGTAGLGELGRALGGAAPLAVRQLVRLTQVVVGDVSVPVPAGGVGGLLELPLPCRWGEPLDVRVRFAGEVLRCYGTRATLEREQWLVPCRVRLETAGGNVVADLDGEGWGTLSLDPISHPGALDAWIEPAGEGWSSEVASTRVRFLLRPTAMPPLPAVRRPTAPSFDVVADAVLDLSLRYYCPDRRCFCASLDGTGRPGREALGADERLLATLARVRGRSLEGVFAELRGPADPLEALLEPYRGDLPRGPFVDAASGEDASAIWTGEEAAAAVVAARAAVSPEAAVASVADLMRRMAACPEPRELIRGKGCVTGVERASSPVPLALAAVALALAAERGGGAVVEDRCRELLGSVRSLVEEGPSWYEAAALDAWALQIGARAGFLGRGAQGLRARILARWRDDPPGFASTASPASRRLLADQLRAAAAFWTPPAGRR